MGLGAKEIENPIPKVVRTMPFTPLNNILGPEGERWVPIHGIVPHSKAIPAWRDVYALFGEMKAEMEAKKVECGFMITTISTNGFLLEPVFYWPGERNSLVEATIEPHMLAKLPKGTNDEAASALVETIRTRIKEIFLKHGGAHFQIGRTYPYAETREPAALALVEAIKQAVDPQRRVNPGSLGLT
jgi:D-lactate dehydrogenase (cytochrome)